MLFCSEIWCFLPDLVVLCVWRRTSLEGVWVLGVSRETWSVRGFVGFGLGCCFFGVCVY